MKQISSSLASILKKDSVVERDYIIFSGETARHYIWFNLYDDCYNNGNFIGTFVMKRIEITYSDSDLEFKNKEFNAYKEYKLDDGTWESINYGTFVVQSIEESDTKEEIKVTGYDYALKFANQYKTDLDYASGNITLFQVLQEICNKVGVELENTSIDNGEFIVDSNQFVESSNFGNVVAEIARISCNFAKITSENKLKLLFKNETNIIIETKDYEEFEDKRDTLPYNAVSLGITDVDGENVSLIAPGVEPDDAKFLIINDSPFAYTQVKRTELIQAIFDKINGFGYSSFVLTNCLYPQLECGDLIQIRNKEGQLVDSIVLRPTFEDVVINFEAPSTISSSVKYVQPLSAIEVARNVEFKVDKANLKIALKVDKDGVISAINLTPEESKILAGKISLEGYTTINGGFIVDEQGNATMNNAKINGGNIELVDNGSEESDPTLIIYNENQIINVKKPLSVGIDLSGKELNFELPDIFEGTQTGVSLAFVNLVEFENGSLRYNYGYQYSSYINLYFYENSTGNFTMIYTGDGISSPSINLKSITLPSNLGKITSINTDIKDTTNNKNLVDYIYYNVRQIGDRTEFNSDGVYIKRGDNYSYYSADGMIIKDKNGTRKFTKNGITWMPPYGYNYIDFIVNSENILYGGRYLTTSENILWTRVVDQAEPYLELNLDNPVQGAIAYGVDVWASDKRLKDNISDSTYNALELVKKIKHRQFNYKSSSKKINIGYVADELEELDENLIFEVGKDKIKQPKESYIIPILSKAIQEMADNYDKKIAQLEEKIKILENKIGGK